MGPVARMRVGELVALLLLFACTSSTLSCCCTYSTSCRCNLVGCNCDTHDGGWCYYWHSGIEQCRAEHNEMCNAFASDGGAGTEIEHPTYREMYQHLIGIPALQVFYNHDLDKDGVISFEELVSKNISKAGFNLLDENQDGVINPHEIDSSLN